MKVSYSYLKEQFKNPEQILEDIRELVLEGDFTLGKRLEKFEDELAIWTGSKYAVGVCTGTDALRLSLAAHGIGSGDEVITAVNTFYSTAGAIATIGAKPIFVDVNDNAVMDAGLLEGAITDKTKAIIPVHLNGCPANVKSIMNIAKKHNLVVIEDACQALGSEIDRKKAGTFGDCGCFSLHPLKPINVWGEGGIVVTDSGSIKDKLHLLRNNGLIGRDECKVFAYNSRLAPIQAVVGLHVLKQVDWIISKRVSNGNFYDKELKHVKSIITPPRKNNVKNIHHNYIIFTEERDGLLNFLTQNGIDAKIHYPIPLHLQEASRYLGYKEGDFPVAESQAKKIISLPCHQYLTEEQLNYVVTKIKQFYYGKNQVC